MASTSDQDFVRILVYGGSTRTGTLSVADIGTVIDNSANVWYGAAQVARAEAAAQDGVTSKKVGDLALEWDSAQLRSLAKDWETRGARAAKPYAGAVSESDIDAENTQTDRPPMPFRLGMHDHSASTST